MQQLNQIILNEIKIGFVGGGNMAQAMVTGLLSSVDADKIHVSDPVDEIRDKLADLGVHTYADSLDMYEKVDVLVLAIKPQLFTKVLPSLAGKLTKQLVISIAAGMPIQKISELLSHDKIIRAMPNTPALIKQGATGLFAPAHISAEDKNIAEQIIATTGLSLWVDTEDKLHAVTAVSGSAPAYFFYVMESMIQAGVELGLTDEQAKALTLQTAVGAAQMALDSSDEPDVLRKKVTSPNGTTQAAIESMQSNAIQSKIMEAMRACADRSVELAAQV